LQCAENNVSSSETSKSERDGRRKLVRVCVCGGGVGGVGVACHVSPPLFLARGQMKCNNRRQFATKRIQTNRRS